MAGGASEILIDKFKALQRNDFVPAMMFTDLKLVDENNCLIAESFYRTNNINPQDNLKNNNLLWRSTVYGCTCIMNKKLVDIALPIPTYAHMHDQWLALLAKQYGNIFISTMRLFVIGNILQMLLVVEIKRHFKNLIPYKKT